MNDNELRDRIARSQRRVLKRRALISDVDLAEYLAQEIIDDLGLTVETGEGLDSPNGDGPITLDGMMRVVGRWEDGGHAHTRS